MREALACVLGPASAELLLAEHPALTPTAPSSSAGPAFLDALNAQGRAAPVEAFRLAASAPVSGPRLPEAPVTLVVFPGVFGEFIDDRAFGGVFAARSSLRDTWAIKLAEARGRDARLGVDASYDLLRLGEVERPLEELVALGSLDKDDGTPAVRVILLQTPRFSLESIGSLDELSPIFLRRLERVFEVLGEVPPHLALLGYSMGTPLALDVLARAEGRPWTRAVKAVVSLAGVSYGSTAADAVLDPQSADPAAQQLRLIQETTRALELTRGELLPRARNYRRWARFGLELRRLRPEEAPESPGRRLPDPRTLGLGDARSTVGLLLSVLRTFTPRVGRLGGVLPDLDADHDLNVQRWQRLVERALAGVGNLTTEARLAWWQTHTVPSEPRYYALPAVFATPERNAAIARNRRAVEPASIDTLANLATHRDYVASGGTPLNDGQVGLHQVRFWPELACALNPAQAPFVEEQLGVLACHHWSPALATGLSGTSPFPREALLQAIGLKLGWDLQAAAGQPVQLLPATPAPAPQAEPARVRALTAVESGVRWSAGRARGGLRRVRVLGDAARRLRSRAG